MEEFSMDKVFEFFTKIWNVIATFFTNLFSFKNPFTGGLGKEVNTASKAFGVDSGKFSFGLVIVVVIVIIILLVLFFKLTKRESYGKRYAREATKIADNDYFESQIHRAQMINQMERQQILQNGFAQAPTQPQQSTATKFGK